MVLDMNTALRASFCDTDRVVDGERFIHWSSLSSYMNCALNGELRAGTKHQLDTNKRWTEKLCRENTEFFMGEWCKLNVADSGKDVLAMKTHPLMEAFENELMKFNADNLENITARRRKRRRRYTEDSGEYDYERGQETDFCMQDWKPRYVNAQAHGLIDVVCEFGGSCKLKNHQLENSGLAACALTDALESMGYSVRVVGVTRGTKIDRVQSVYAGGTINQSMTLKDYGESLNIGRIGFALATGQFYRICAFTNFTKACVGKVSDHLGFLERCSLSRVSNMSWGVSSNCIFIERMTDRDKAADAVKRFIERKKKQVVETDKEVVGYGYDKR